MSQKRASSDAPKALRAGELRHVMDAIRGGPQEDPPLVAPVEPDDASGERSVESSGVFRVDEVTSALVEDLGPVSSAPPALRPERLRDVLEGLGNERS